MTEIEKQFAYVLEDPRSSNTFRTDLFPLIDGARAPSQPSTDLLQQRKLQFAVTYYHLNLLSEALEEVRRLGIEDSPTLLRLEKLLQVRDTWEDRMTQVGVYAEPVMRNGRAIDLRFCTPPSSAPHYYSAWVSVPLPPGVLEELRSQACD